MFVLVFFSSLFEFVCYFVQRYDYKDLLIDQYFRFFPVSLIKEESYVACVKQDIEDEVSRGFQLKSEP